MCTIPMGLIFGVRVEVGDVWVVSFVLGRIVGNQPGPDWQEVVQDLSQDRLSFISKLCCFGDLSLEVLQGERYLAAGFKA